MMDTDGLMGGCPALIGAFCMYRTGLDWTGLGQEVIIGDGMAHGMGN